MRRILLLTAFVTIAPAFGSCSTESIEPVPVMPHDQAASLFEGLEADLLQASEIQLRFHVTATGAVTADLEGSLSIAADGNTLLTAAGEFAGEHFRLEVAGKGKSMFFGQEGSLQEVVRPDGLEESLLVGLTRMGVLHNLAMLTGGAAPDHAQGGVQDWVKVATFHKDMEGVSTIGFSLTVAGEPSGNATLTFDEEGYPSFRHQRVVFPEGVMDVEERYSGFVVRP